MRTTYSCSEASAILLLDDMDAMAHMVKSMALDNPAMRAPKIAIDVWKHFEDKYKGESSSCHKYLIFFSINYKLFRNCVLVVGPEIHGEFCLS